MRTPPDEQRAAEAQEKQQIAALIPEIRKQEYQDVRGISVMRILHPLQDFLTRLLVRTSISPQQLAVVWIALSLGSYAVSSVGTPIAFVVGALILYLAIVLDLCDGELGRYRAMSMTPEEDFQTFVHGMFLDRIAHLALTPLWPLAVAWGLFAMCGDAVVFLAGLALASYHTVCRALPHVRSYLREFFQGRIAELDDQYVAARSSSSAPRSAGWGSRLVAKIELWVRNGKRFNCLILIGGLADCIMISVREGQRPVVLLWLFLTWGSLAALFLVHAVVAPIWSGRLVSDTLEECRKQAG